MTQWKPRGYYGEELPMYDGRWRQTTKDGAPAAKSIPPRDLERVVAVIEGEVL